MRLSMRFAHADNARTKGMPHNEHHRHERQPLRLTLAVLLTVSNVVIACVDPPLQGDPYLPDGRLPIGPASERPDATCDDASPCDAAVADARPPAPVRDAQTADPPNTCETARAIGTIAGDVGSPSVTAQGSCSEWLSVRVTEDSSSALGVAMRAKLSLTPAGGDFDLYALFDPVRDVRACTAPYASSFAPGTAVETISLTWGEGSVANGSDDGRTIGIAVLKAGGVCGPDAGTWTLVVEGNQ